MKKMLLSLFLILSLVFSCCSVGFATVPQEDPTVDTRATSSISVGVSRDSGTDASASIVCNFAGIMDSYTITVYLQKLSNGNWISDTSNEDYVKRVSGTNREHRLFDVFYDDLTRGTSYRLKIVSKTVYGTTTYTRSGYSATF